MKKLTSAALWYSLLALVTVAPAVQAQTIGRVPAFVVSDSNGNPIGPVVGIDANLNLPLIRFTDPDADVPVILRVRTDTRLTGAVTKTYFSNPDCSGDVFHDASLTIGGVGMAAIYGHIYSVAVSGGSQRLYRADVGGEEAIQSYDSTYTAAEGCTNNTTNSDVLVPATKVVDLDAMFPPPYSGG